uniref:head-tail connector protein n=1 Tax=Enterocloster clostridioformis TaxID=1531 RepID=UPI0025A4D005|nr:head-tail connector protein [Enterocloster clostridioformis]
MKITLQEAKEYLRVDYGDEDELIASLIESAQSLCMSIARIDTSEDFLGTGEIGRIATLYTVGYLYEHREEADHHELTLTLRSLLFGIRKEGF